MVDYACIASPLTEQHKKDSLGLTKSAKTAFEQLKQAMVTSPVLLMPNFHLEFILEADTSGYGVGVILM